MTITQAGKARDRSQCMQSRWDGSKQNPEEEGKVSERGSRGRCRDKMGR